MANSFQFESAWVLDLGGGSAQVSWMRERQFVEGKAYPLGAVRLTEKYLVSDPPTNKEVKRLDGAIVGAEDQEAGSNPRDQGRSG